MKHVCFLFSNLHNFEFDRFDWFNLEKTYVFAKIHRSHWRIANYANLKIGSKNVTYVLCHLKCLHSIICVIPT